MNCEWERLDALHIACTHCGQRVRSTNLELRAACSRVRVNFIEDTGPCRHRSEESTGDVPTRGCGCGLASLPGFTCGLTGRTVTEDRHWAGQQRDDLCRLCPNYASKNLPKIRDSLFTSPGD